MLNRKLSALTLLVGILSAFTTSPAHAVDFKSIANAGGFIYDASQDIYVTKIDSKQRSFGFSKLFDFLSVPSTMVIDAEPITFSYQGIKYMIELWKGQYHIMAGAEIGMYQEGFPGWKSIEDAMMPRMSFELYKEGQLLFTREGVHWWLTGFYPGVFANPEELTMEHVVIEFNSEGMRDAFLQGLRQLGYQDQEDHIIAEPGQSSVSFRFTKPKAKQPWAPVAKRAMQMLNQRLVTLFNNRKAAVGGVDNSPETIDLMRSGVKRP